MKRYLAIMLSALFLLTALPLNGLLSVAAADDPTVNGDAVLYENFDDGDTGVISSSSDISVVDGVLQFNVNKDWGNIYAELESAEENTDYVVSFKAKSKLGKNYWVKFNDGWCRDVASADMAVSQEWEEYSFSLNSGDFGSLVFLIQYAGYAAEGETLWIDDLTIVKAGAMPDEPDEPDEPVKPVGGLLVNGGFENGSEGWNWGSSASISDDARTGNGALRIENPGMWSEAASQTVAVEPNTNYVLNLWTKRVKNTGLFDIFFMDAVSYRNLSVIEGQNWFNTHDMDWTERSIVFNTGDATEIILKWSSETSNAGVILFDDVRLYKEGEDPDQPANPGNPVVNGDFETGDATGWETWQDTEICEESAKSGQYGAHLQGNGSWGSLLNQTFAVEVGQEYTITMWVFINSKGGANLQIKGAEKIEGECDNTYLDPNELKDWALRTFNVVATEDAITLNFCGAGTGRAEDVYIDDIVVVKKGETPPTSGDNGPIKNSGFETGDLTSWINLWSACDYWFESPGHGGSQYALSVEMFGQWRQIRQDKIPVEKNTDYVLVGYSKNAYNMDVVVKSGDDMYNITECYLPNDWSNTWKRFEIPFNSSDLTDICVLLISYDYYASALFDNIQLYKAGEVPEEPEEPPVTEGPMYLDSFGTANNRPVNEEANLIENGSFENAEGGQWQSILGDTLYVVEDTTAPEGGKSLYFDTVGVEPEDKAVFHVDVEPDTDYVFSVWVKGAFISNNNRFNATVGVVDYRNNFLVHDDTVFSNKQRQIVPTCWDNEWHLRAVSFNSGVNTRVGIAFAGGLSQMWVDGMALFKAEDGVKYTVDCQVEYIIASPALKEEGYCAAENNLVPGGEMSGDEAVEFWSQASGYGNGFLSFEGGAMKYAGSENSYDLHTIRWIDVEPNTDYTFSVDLRILESGGGKLMLFDGKKRDYYPFLMIDFDEFSYGVEWFTATITFNSGPFDRIGIAVMDGGGAALIDNMRLFESRYRIDKPIETGDVNGDGQINNRDLGLLMQYLCGWNVSVNKDACDMDGNGKLNNKDLGLLQRLLNE